MLYSSAPRAHTTLPPTPDLHPDPTHTLGSLGPALAQPCPNPGLTLASPSLPPTLPPPWFHLSIPPQVEVAQRLGSSARAADDVVGHAWFEAVDMDGLVNLVVQVSVVVGR